MEQFKLEKMDIDLGDEFNEAKASLNSFKKSYIRLKSYKISEKCEYFSELRNKIDLDREITKNNVDKHYLGLIDEVNKIEIDCKKNEIKEIEYHNVIEHEETKLSKLKEDLDALKIDTKMWSDLQIESDNDVKLVKRIIRDFERELLSFNDYTYESAGLDEFMERAKIIRISVCF